MHTRTHTHKPTTLTWNSTFSMMGTCHRAGEERCFSALTWGSTEPRGDSSLSSLVLPPEPSRGQDTGWNARGFLWPHSLCLKSLFLYIWLTLAKQRKQNPPPSLKSGKFNYFRITQNYYRHFWGHSRQEPGFLAMELNSQLYSFLYCVPGLPRWCQR